MSRPLLLALAVLLSAPARAQDKKDASDKGPDVFGPITVSREAVFEPSTAPNTGLANPCDKSEGYQQGGDEDLYPEKKSCAGQTRARLRRKLGLNWNGRDGAEGESLIFVDELKVSFDLEQEIFVSADYPKDSCPYRVTLAHEAKHWKDGVRIQQETAKALFEKLKQLVPTKDKPAKQPRKQAVIDAYQAQVKAQIGDLIRAHSKIYHDAAVAAVAKLDAPESYEAEYNQCPAKDWKSKAP